MYDDLEELTAGYRPLSEGDSQTSTTPERYSLSEDVLAKMVTNAPIPNLAERYSLSEDELDKMVASASIPNLAALMKQGLDSGLISPQPKYK